MTDLLRGVFGHCEVWAFALVVSVLLVIAFCKVQKGN